MSDRYKFRGRTIKTYENPSKWVYGYYHFDGVTHWITNPKADRVAYSVDPKTVGQFTGLCDKDGKQWGIDWWEGDILKGMDGKVGEIKYNSEFAEFAVYVDRDYWCSLGAALYDGWGKIGNIHDNPELLEVKNEQRDN